MITYFSRTLLGVFLPVSTVLPVLLLIISLRWGNKFILPPKKYLIALVMGFLGVVSGFIVNQEFVLTKIGAPFLAVCTFMTGYMVFRWIDRKGWVINSVIIICGLYIIVCLIALFGLYPSLFPVINAEWSNHGVLELRPEVTTDQNFQVFYLMPLIPLMVINTKFWKSLIILPLIFLGVIVLMKLQTRSGVMVYITLAIMTWATPLWSKRYNKSKMILLPIVALVVIVVYHNAILNIASLLIARFGESGAEGAAEGRLISITYFFQHIWNPLWWLPRGYSDFMSQHHGDIPHSNITAMLLEAGILGVYMWFMLFLVPPIKLTSYYFKKKLHGIDIMVYLVGISMLVLQLTLNVPFFKQPWLWAGSVVGLLERLINSKSESNVQKEEITTEEHIESSVRLK